MSELAAGGHASLLKFLVQNNLLAADVAQQAQEARSGEDDLSPIEWLARKGLVVEEDLARAVAERLRLPYVNLADYVLEPDVVAVVREDLAFRYKVVPLRLEKGNLVIATANPFEREVVRALEFATGHRVSLEVATVTGLRDALEHTYHMDDSLSAYLRGVPAEMDLAAKIARSDSNDLQHLARETELAPIIKLLNLIILEAIRDGASDIHIEPTLSEVCVRYRIDGMLRESFRLPRWVRDALIARCKVLATLDITERRVPQDGSIRINYRKSQIDLRVSSLPSTHGESVVMRILSTGRAPDSLNGLDLSPRDLQWVERAIRRPQGMILVTGPTGSGKTTTLYSMLGALISPTRKIITVENPVERQLRGITQVEINEKQGLTFANTLRAILRQDPDVILVGEIRDSETASIALRAAQTGHLVFSTVHTNDCVSTVTRLIDLGIEPFMLASSLNLVLAQRLVRRNCRRCEEPYAPEAATLAPFPLKAGEVAFKHGKGCDACRKTGFSGRLPVFEAMPVTPRLARLIAENASEATLRREARRDGMHLLFEDAANKVAAGITTPEEVLRVVDPEGNESKCPACRSPVEDTFLVCPSCAAPLRHRCPSCDKDLQREWLHCPYCGSATTGGIEASAEEIRSDPRAVNFELPSPSAVPAPSSRRAFRILIVEDDRTYRQLIAKVLQDTGLPIAVEMAEDGIEGLALAQSHPPDLVMLDVVMPGLDGLGVCAQLRGNVRTAFVPILMLSGLGGADDRVRAFMAGTDDYVVKPFDRSELLARVRRILERTYGGLSCEAGDILDTRAERIDTRPEN
jgi:type II secretory ATPase GspE/PulE/Tfp pilus assembly ATPase PilB-like protein/ActR/RegA family two-component response regulator